MSISKQVHIHQMVMPLEAHDEHITENICEQLHVEKHDIIHWQLARKALDSRHKPKWVLAIDVTLKPGCRYKLSPQVTIVKNHQWQLPVAIPESKKNQPVIIIGSGPAGLSCAHVLAACGLKPIVFERGGPVEQRGSQVAALLRKGLLNTESNFCFGEGGAGTYSDGKLMTRKNDPKISWLYQLFASLCDAQELTYDAHPHIGTDRLVHLLKKWRLYLNDHGVEFHFNQQVTDLILDAGACNGVVTKDALRYAAGFVVLAAGHSARDLWKVLLQRGIQLQAMPFAMGVRLEHPQQVINKWRYKRWHKHPLLPSAEYALTYNGQQACHSFCMCPGGTIVPTPTEHDGLVVNGMSGSKRNGRFANAAIITHIKPEQLPCSGPQELRGVAYQRQWEKKFFADGFKAPSQPVLHFLGRDNNKSVYPTSYSRGLQYADFKTLLPPLLYQPLHDALQFWWKKYPLLADERAQLVGLESRPSSPVRIMRNDDGIALGVTGLYPCGEGAGYASGITSCALDGLQAALHIINKL